MGQYTFKYAIDIPVGHAFLNFGPVTSKDEQECVYAFAIGFNEEYNDPNSFCESPKGDYEYELAILLRKPEQAEAYADMFSKMAKRMQEIQKEKEENRRVER